jgi:hypothetical protein
MSTRRFGPLMTACLVVPALAACGGSDRAASPGATQPRDEPVTASQLLEREFTVLADSTHGPQLCTAVETSLPPHCVVERDGPTEQELATVQRRLNDRDARRALGVVTEASADGRRGVVVGKVWVVTQPVLDYARDRWGDRVELHGNLTPVR